MANLAATVETLPPPPSPPSCRQEDVASEEVDEDLRDADSSLMDSDVDESVATSDKFDRLEFDNFNDNLQNEDWIDLKFLEDTGLEGVRIRANLIRFVEDFREISRFAVPKTFVRYVYKLLDLLKGNVCLSYLKEEHLVRAVLHLTAFRQESRHLLLPRSTNSVDHEYEKTFDVFVSLIHLLLIQIFRHYPRQANSSSNPSDDFMALYQVFKPPPSFNLRRTWARLTKTPEEGDVLPAGPFFVCPSTRMRIPSSGRTGYPCTKGIPYLGEKLDGFFGRLLQECPVTACVACTPGGVFSPTDDFFILICFHVLCLRCGDSLHEGPKTCPACTTPLIAWTTNACRILYRRERGRAGEWPSRS